VLGDLGSSSDGADAAGFMLFDTVLAFEFTCSTAS